MRSTEAIDAARGAARRALELDPDSADAHAALGSVLFFGDWDWGGARREYDRAVALDPVDPEAFHARSLLRMAAGEVEDGLADVRRALELDPLSPAINRAYTTHLYFARRYDEAVAQGRKALELEPTDTGPWTTWRSSTGSAGSEDRSSRRSSARPTSRASGTGCARRVRPTAAAYLD